MILTFLSQADCCAAVAAGASGVNCGKMGRGKIVTTAGKSSTGSAVIVFPGNDAHAVSDDRNPRRPFRM